MNIAAQTVFWTSLLLLFITWFGYYLVISMLFHLLRKMRGKGLTVSGPPLMERYPFLSVIIAARNEEKTIERRIENLRMQDYPEDRFEIIVASDGSTDRTVELASQIGDPRVRTLDFKQGVGKATVHNRSMPEARGEILLFTDAGTRFEKDCLTRITLPFQDPRVGAVTGRLAYFESDKRGAARTATKFWDLETKLRVFESELGILSFGVGACTALRKGLYHEIAPSEDTDFAQTINVVMRGYRVAFVPEAVATDTFDRTISATFRNKSRKANQAFRGILSRLFTRDIIRRPHVFLSILSHKTLRHLTPFLLCAAYVANLRLAGSNLFYALTFSAQSAFYAGCFAGILFRNSPRVPRLLVHSGTFMVWLLGSTVGVLQAIKGNLISKW